MLNQTLQGVLRTTHQTGAVTDLGLVCGQWLQLATRGSSSKLKRPEYWRASLSLPLLLSYFLGGFCGIAAVANDSYLWYSLF